MFLQQQVKTASQIITGVAALLLVSTSAFAQAPKGKPLQPNPQPQAHTQGQPAQGQAAAPATDDKLDVSDLEKKYWAAKDTDFNVVQNRVYSKAHRFALSADIGTMVNDPWATGTTYGGNLAYYFNERWGIEATYTYTDSQDNQAVQRLKGQFGYPDHNLIKDFYGLQVDWVPFYAKMSLLNWTIVYFDMQFALGAGMLDYQQQKDDGNTMVGAPAVTFDVTQNFFLNKYFAIRVDLKNRWYQEETVKYRANSVPTGSSRSNGTQLSNTTLLLLGLTLFY